MQFQIECRIEDTVVVQAMVPTITIQWGQAIRAVAMIKIGIMDKGGHTNAQRDLNVLNTTIETVAMAAQAVQAVQAVQAAAMEATVMAETVLVDIEVEATLMVMMISDHMTKLTGMLWHWN